MEGNAQGPESGSPTKRERSGASPEIQASIQESATTERARKVGKLQMIAASVSAVLALGVGGQVVLDSLTKPSRESYGQVLPAPENLSTKERTAENEGIKSIVDQVVAIADPSAIEAQDVEKTAAAQSVHETLDNRFNYINEEGEIVQGGTIQVKDQGSGDLTHYFYEVNRDQNTNALTSVSWGAIVAPPVADSDSLVPEEDQLLAESTTKIFVLPDGNYTIDQRAGWGILAGTTDYKYPVYKKVHEQVTTGFVEGASILNPRPLVHRDAFAANTNLQDITIAAAARKPFAITFDKDGGSNMLLGS